MSAQYLQFTTMEAFDTWHAEAMTALGLPNVATLTSAYSYALPGADGFFYAPIDAACPAELLEGLTLIDTSALIRDAETGEVLGVEPA